MSNGAEQFTWTVCVIFWSEDDTHLSPFLFAVTQSKYFVIYATYLSPNMGSSLFCLVYHRDGNDLETDVYIFRRLLGQC